MAHANNNQAVRLYPVTQNVITAAEGHGQIAEWYDFFNGPAGLGIFSQNLSGFYSLLGSFWPVANLENSYKGCWVTALLTSNAAIKKYIASCTEKL